MQGIFLSNRRPKSKKEIKEAIADPQKRIGISIEQTSIMGNDFGGYLDQMKIGQKIHFVGPDPYKKRNFYGSITRVSQEKFKVE